MQPEPTPPAKKKLVDRVALITFVGLCTLSVLGTAMVTIYLNRIGESTAAISRTELMPGYVGRPQPATGTDGSTPTNFLLLVTSDSSLHSVVVANLSASRRSLTLVTVPADLVVSTSPGQTLRSAYAMDPAITVRAMEGLTGARMDHQVLLDLDCFATAIDLVGGVEIGGSKLDGDQAVSQVATTAGTGQAALASGQLLRAGLIGAGEYASILNPSKFSQVVSAISPCVQIDSGLTGQVFENTLMESSVHPQETRLWPLVTSLDPQGSLAEPSPLEALRDALATPEMSSTEQYRSAAFLPRERGR